MRVSVLFMVLLSICYHVQSQSYVGIEREYNKFSAESLLSCEKPVYIASNNPVFQLDSVFSYRTLSGSDSVLYEKVLYQYDLEKNITTEISYSFSEDQRTWIPYYKREFNTLGNDVLRVDYIFENETQTWVLQSKYESRYNSMGQQIYMYDYKLKDVSGVEYGYRKEAEYDRQGNNTLTVLYSYNAVQKEWIINRKEKTEYEFSENGLVHYAFLYTWDEWSQEWNKVQRVLFDFDGSGNVIRQIYSSWNSFLSQWDISSREEYTYDNAGNVLSEQFFTYDGGLNKWNNGRKYLYQYDQAGNEILIESYQWNTEINDWKGIEKFEKQYNSVGLQDLWMVYNWDQYSKLWKPGIKITCEFDNYWNQTIYSVYLWSEGNSSWQIGNMNKYDNSYDSFGNITRLLISSWDIASASLKQGFINHLYYTQIDDSVPANLSYSNFGISVFPNPVSTSLFILGADDANVEVFSLAGAKIMAFSRVSSSVDISSLKQGVYVVKITNGKQHCIKRIIKC